VVTDSVLDIKFKKTYLCFYFIMTKVWYLCSVNVKLTAVCSVWEFLLIHHFYLLRVFILHILFSVTLFFLTFIFHFMYLFI